MEHIWHIKNKSFKESKSLSSVLNILYQEGCTYIMDNHLAAGWCWYNTLDRHKEYNFCHIDQHDDLANDSHDIVQKLFSENRKISLEEYTSLHYVQAPQVVLPPAKALRWDNYILHMKSVFPHWFKKEIYACNNFVSGERCSVINVQLYDSEFDLDSGIQKCPIHPININCYDLSQTLEEQISNNEERLWIVNLDIDYFFHGKIQLFTDAYIEAICNQIVKEKAKIAVLTIALSPECCNSWDNSIRVYNYIAERLSLEMRL